jgi:RNA polymerase sigma factor (sigma-70 family)
VVATDVQRGRALLSEETGKGSAAERSLAARLRAGDEHALAELYDTYSSFVFGLALRVLRDRGAAEDITQDVFVGLWTQPDRFDPDRGSLRAFLGTLTHRRAVDLIRSEESRKKREDKTSAEEPFVPQVDDEAVRSVTARTVRVAVASLPVNQREALELAYFDGCTYRQVAERLGIPEGTAKSRLRLGLHTIAELLDPELLDSGMQG